MKTSENKVHSNKNRNTRFVNVKQNRMCNYCGQMIPKNTKCLSTNKQGIGRRWYCMSCVRHIEQESILPSKFDCKTYQIIEVTKAQILSAPFGDDGYVLALQECLDEKIAECMECNRYNSCYKKGY